MQQPGKPFPPPLGATGEPMPMQFRVGAGVATKILVLSTFFQPRSFSSSLGFYHLQAWALGDFETESFVASTLARLTPIYSANPPTDELDCVYVGMEVFKHYGIVRYDSCSRMGRRLAGEDPSDCAYSGLIQHLEGTSNFSVTHWYTALLKTFAVAPGVNGCVLYLSIKIWRLTIFHICRFLQCMFKLSTLIKAQNAKQCFPSGFDEYTQYPTISPIPQV